MMRRKLMIPVLIVLIILSAFVLVEKVISPGYYFRDTETDNGIDQFKQVEFDKAKYSLSDTSSLWVIVNKRNSIPTDYVPKDLVVPNVKLRLGSGNEQMKFRTIAQKDLISMFNSASKDNINLVFGSGYRSATLQSQFYNSYVAQDGQKAADTYSARPGYSEHQTGLAVDLTSPSGACHLEICWAETAEGKWVAKNSYKFGFVIRYLKNKDKITGYQYEPWHLRYVGKSLASEIKNKTTLEEFFDLVPAPKY